MGTNSLTPEFPFRRFRRSRFSDGVRCPHCGATRVHRWGSFAGRQRYRCVACRRTFSDFTATPLANLKRVDLWPDFCRCVLESRSVRDTAERTGIHRDTAFRWRHRLLRSLDAVDRGALTGSVVYGETWFPFSQKGSRKLDRPPRRRPAFHRADIKPVWVYVLVAGDGRLATGVAGVRRPTAAVLLRAVGNRLSGDVELMSCNGPFGAGATLAIRLDVRHCRSPQNGQGMTGVRRYVGRLRRWITRFRGVATRYLASYLAWHRFLEMSERAAEPCAFECLLAMRFP
ncbi:MAG: IS1595 family transposase [Gemmatimonadota bacterium]